MRIDANELGNGGRALWDAVNEAHELDIAQRIQLIEACRAKDRLDKLDQILSGDVDTWATLTSDEASGGDVFEVRITDALVKANQTATILKQLLAALRLPDEATGRRPQQRGAPRGAYATSGGSSKVSSLERARARKSS